LSAELTLTRTPHPLPTVLDRAPSSLSAVVAALSKLLSAWPARLDGLLKAMSPRSRLALVFAVGMTAGVLLAGSMDSLQIYQTVDDIPGRYFRQQKEIPCMVVTVSDGDTIRVMHTPPLSAPRRALENRARARAGGKAPKLSLSTMQIRLAAVDTPEVAKFGKPAQPYADEAKEYVQQRLLHKRIHVKLLSRDQYGRAVASIKYTPALSLIRHDLGEDLLKDGLAVVYRQGGAQYDSPDGVDKWNRIEARAKASGRGMWAGKKRLELPSEYKARLKKQAAPAAAAAC
jgi:endonuclease YncB( thermonuclease family)